MAIMAMDTVNNINKRLFAVSLSLITSLSHSGEWTFEPNLGLEEIFTDNVKLAPIDPTSTFVGQVIGGLDAKYKSNLAELTFSGTKSYALYSYDSKSNKDYRTLQANGSLDLWSDGITFVGSANISNVSRNNADNSFADIITGDTVESANYSSGFSYNIGNTSYSVQSSIMYSTTRTEDDIGESDGFTASLNSTNGNAARHVYWQLSSNYTKREQQLYNSNDPEATNDGENYVVDALFGAITPINLNPFVRFYDEDVKGTAAGLNAQTTSSWGPGLRWLASDHVIIDLSYNFVADETVSDDYVAASIDWQPSGRTSLKAGFSQRFFGKSYNLDFKHKTRRLTNNIFYNETLEVFDRSNYQNVELGSYWCPTTGFIGDIEQCSPENQPPVPPDGYQLIPFSNLELVESNEYSINKRFSWSSILQLSRSSFTFTAGATEREGLETGIVDNSFDLGLSFSRRTSVRGNISISGSFRHSLFDKTNPEGVRQDDYYRTASTTYSLELASALSSHFTLRYINRTSNIERYIYDEVRAIINITKEF